MGHAKDFGMEYAPMDEQNVQVLTANGGVGRDQSRPTNPSVHEVEGEQCAQVRECGTRGQHGFLMQLHPNFLIQDLLKQESEHHQLQHNHDQ